MFFFNLSLITENEEQDPATKHKTSDDFSKLGIAPRSGTINNSTQILDKIQSLPTAGIC